MFKAKCTECGEIGEFGWVGPYRSQCKNCKAVLKNEELDLNFVEAKGGSNA